MLVYLVKKDERIFTREKSRKNALDYITKTFGSEIAECIAMTDEYVGETKLYGYGKIILEIKDIPYRAVPAWLVKIGVHQQVFEDKQEALFSLREKHHSYSEYFEEKDKSEYGDTEHLKRVSIIKNDFDMSDVRFFIKKCRHYYTHCGIGELIIDTKSRTSRITKVSMVDKSEEITVYLRSGDKTVLYSGYEWYVLIRWMRDNVVVPTMDNDYIFI